jgi:hypothetical protein
MRSRPFGRGQWNHAARFAGQDRRDRSQWHIPGHSMVSDGVAVTAAIHGALPAIDITSN